MKALVKKLPKKGLWLEDVDEPICGLNEVKIKIKKTSICGTDLHIYNWDEWSQETIPVPMTIGHEFVGTISELGTNVKGYKIGDLVSGEGHIVCGHCRNCLAGRRHLCINTEGVGVNRSGAFAEYLVIPASNVWLCDSTINMDLLSSFDPFGNAAHTALSFDMVGEDVLITGAGPIGIMATAIARHVGARHIVVSDVNPYRLDLAKKMGASTVVDVRDHSIEDAMKELHMKEGFDVGLEMSGNEKAFNSMLNNMEHGGKIAMLGIQSKNTKIDWNKVIFNGLTIKGIYGREMYETWYKMTSMIQSGLDITPIITHKYHYTEFEKGFEVMASGHCGKVVLSWE